jgi:UDP-glucose 4-epimerase
MARSLRAPEFFRKPSLSWGTSELAPQLRQAARDYAASVGSAPWQVCWCAGAGVVGTSEAAVAAETAALRELLLALAEQPALARSRGAFLLCSSAGGVYGGSGERRITENTEPRPISPYGRAKLEQERALRELLPRFSQLSTLTARLSNLYGPGQRLDKPQGLISHMARSAVVGLPIHVYVPLDTMRDYLFVDDAARALSCGLERLQRSTAPTQWLKIYASETDTSIARLLAIFRGVVKRRLSVVAGLHAVGAQQPRQLSFRSTLWSEDGQCIRTDLVSGVGLVYRNQLRQFQLGRS